MKTEIRTALITDVPAILELVQGLADYEKEPEAVVATAAHYEETGFGDKPIWKAFVAIVENRTVGFALIYDRFSTWKGKMVYLEDFYVIPEYRKFGLGAQLFETVIDYAKTNKYSGLVWQVLDWNDLAIKFYEKYQTEFDKGWWNGKIMF
jgi:GNAT superfamily N-acetyltransferase